MRLLRFGHAGQRVLIFPTRDGSFHEYEDLRIIEAMRPWIEAGHMQLVCLENIAHESLYCFWCRPEDRLRRYLAYERYVLHEVMPWWEDVSPSPPGFVAHGLSLGAFMATNMALRHPHLFHRLVAFSGRFDLTQAMESFTDLLQGHYDDTVYFNTPLHFLPNLDDERLLHAVRGLKVCLVVGRDDPFLAQNQALHDTLLAKGGQSALHVWDGRAHQGGAWRRMAPLYLPNE